MDSTTSGIAPLLATTAATNAVTAVAPAKTTASASVAKTARPDTPKTSAQDTALQRDPRSLQFQVDGDRVITTIVDENNKTVVVQIPDADMIAIAKAIDRMQGFLVKEQA